MSMKRQVKRVRRESYSTQQAERLRQVVTLDLAAPRYIIAPSDRRNLALAGEMVLEDATERAEQYRQLDEVEGAMIVRRATVLLLVEVVGRKYEKGMARKPDGVIWAEWQRRLDDEASLMIELPRGHVEWLMAVFGDDHLALAPGLQQWREEFVAYVEKVLADLDVEQKAVAEDVET